MYENDIISVEKGMTINMCLENVNCIHVEYMWVRYTYSDHVTCDRLASLTIKEKPSGTIRGHIGLVSNSIFCDLIFDKNAFVCYFY